MNFIALLWIPSTTYAVSIDCPNVIHFAYDLGMQSNRPSEWAQLQNDCCSTNGVTCVSQRVTEISWRRMELNGFINGTAIPSNVTSLILADNDLKGPIPSSLPVKLLELDLDRNEMSGDLPLFPSTLQRLYLGPTGNKFSGTLRLNRPIELYIRNNWITDVFIQDSSVLGTGVSDCDLSNNPLLGNPNIAGLTMCTKYGLYSATLLPVTRSTRTTKLASSTSTVITTYQTTNLVFTDVTTIDALATAVEKIITTNVTRTSTLTSTSNLTSSIGTVPVAHGFIVNLGMMVRVLINGMFLTAVFMKTPFKREFKKNIKEKTRSLDTSSIRI